MTIAANFRLIYNTVENIGMSTVSNRFNFDVVVWKLARLLPKETKVEVRRTVAAAHFSNNAGTFSFRAGARQGAKVC